MLIPIRCMTCGKPVGHLWDEYRKQTQAGKKAKDVMDKLGLERYCCRGLFLGHKDLIPQVGKFVK